MGINYDEVYKMLSPWHMLSVQYMLAICCLHHHRQLQQQLHYHHCHHQCHHHRGLCLCQHLQPLHLSLSIKTCIAQWPAQKHSHLFQTHLLSATVMEGFCLPIRFTLYPFPVALCLARPTCSIQWAVPVGDWREEEKPGIVLWLSPCLSSWLAASLDGSQLFPGFLSTPSSLPQFQMWSPRSPALPRWRLLHYFLWLLYTIPL